jgi:hypothetical protein
VLPFAKVWVNIAMKRPLCLVCNQNLAAVNYIKNSQYHYRKMCDSCIRKGKKIKAVPAWFRAGYRKKQICEWCGYKAKYLDKQMTVYHVDGNLKNVSSQNLKTVCLNCRIELAHSHLPWKESPIIPDF